jgi:HEAT repeat protein
MVDAAMVRTSGSRIGASTRRGIAAGLLATALGCGSTGDPWLVKREAKATGPWVAKPSERVASLERVRQDVARATPEQQAKVAQDISKALPGEPDPLIRIEMVRTLAEFPGDVATQAVLEALQDGDEDVRQAACEAAARRDAAVAVPALGKVLTDDADLDVRLAATRALGETRDPAAVAALAPALDQSDPAIQFRATESLKKVSGRNYGRDIAAWREFAQGRDPQPDSGTWMARMRNWFR